MRVKDPAALRRRRINQRFSQRDLAGLVRRTQATIHQLETGKMKTLTEDLALLIAARLFSDWEDLFTLEEHEIRPAVSSGEPIKKHDECKAPSNDHSSGRGMGRASDGGHSSGHGVGKVA